MTRIIGVPPYLLDKILAYLGMPPRSAQFKPTGCHWTELCKQTDEMIAREWEAVAIARRKNWKDAEAEVTELKAEVERLRSALNEAFCALVEDGMPPEGALYKQIQAALSISPGGTDKGGK